MTPAVLPLVGDRIDAELALRFGARRADTARLRTLIEATRTEVRPILRARRARRQPIEGLARSWIWRLSAAGVWRVLAAFDAERSDADANAGVARFFARSKRRDHIGLAMSSIDSVTAVGGPAATRAMIAGDTVAISAFDLEQRELSHDFAAPVSATGDLGDLVPSLPAMWPPGGAS